jgi:hypothetical protein
MTRGTVEDIPKDAIFYGSRCGYKYRYFADGGFTVEFRDESGRFHPGQLTGAELVEIIKPLSGVFIAPRGSLF